MHYGILNAYGHLMATSFTHYFASRYFDYKLLSSGYVESYIGRKILSYVGTPLNEFSSAFYLS